MSSKSRYVFDANTIVSAFLFEQSTPGQALKTALDRGTILLSEEVAVKLTEVLRREKFDHYVSRKKRENLLKAVIQDATLVEITERVEACRDPKDDKYLELAVSGDDDLLVLEAFRGMPVLRPSTFLEWIHK